MSNFHFGVDDYDLDYHPHEGVRDERDYIDWSKVEYVEIDWVTFVRERTCENEWAQFGKFRCSECWLQVDSISTNTTQPMLIKHCPNCGAKVAKPCTS